MVQATPISVSHYVLAPWRDSRANVYSKKFGGEHWFIWEYLERLPWKEHDRVLLLGAAEPKPPKISRDGHGEGVPAYSDTLFCIATRLFEEFLHAPPYLSEGICELLYLLENAAYDWEKLMDALRSHCEPDMLIVTASVYCPELLSDDLELLCKST